MKDNLDNKVLALVEETVLASEKKYWETRVEDVAQLVGVDRYTAYQALRRLNNARCIIMESKGRAGIGLYIPSVRRPAPRLNSKAKSEEEEAGSDLIEAVTVLLNKLTLKQFRFLEHYVLPTISKDKEDQEEKIVKAEIVRDGARTYKPEEEQ